MLSLTFRKPFDGKASYSMVKNGNVLIMISASQAVGILVVQSPGQKYENGFKYSRLAVNSSDL